MTEANEKRMAGDYEIIHALHIGPSEIVIGEYQAAPEGEKYLCAFCVSNELFAQSTCGKAGRTDTPGIVQAPLPRYPQ